jgi:hypothetical protein
MVCPLRWILQVPVRKRLSTVVDRDRLHLLEQVDIAVR